jgi:ferredoxin
VSVRITIDREVCIGSGSCVRLAPGVFELDHEEIAVVVDAEAAGLDDIREAEESCPTGAILVVEDD